MKISWPVSNRTSVWRSGESEIFTSLWRRAVSLLWLVPPVWCSVFLPIWLSRHACRTGADWAGGLLVGGRLGAEFGAWSKLYMTLFSEEGAGSKLPLQILSLDFPHCSRTHIKASLNVHNPNTPFSFYCLFFFCWAANLACSQPPLITLHADADTPLIWRGGETNLNWA